jgi:hypothetical protein
MLRSGMRESETKQIRLHDIGSDTLAFVLRHLYGAEAPPPPELAVEMLIAADMFNLSTLRHQSELVLRRFVELENACTLLLLGIQHHAPLLARIAAGFIVKNFAVVAATPEFAALPASLRERITHYRHHGFDRPPPAEHA